MSTLPLLKRLLAVALLASTLHGSLAQAALLSLQPDTTFATDGDSISLDIVVSDLGDFSPVSLGAFDVSIGFDPTALAFASYDLNSFLGDLGLLEAIDISGGAGAGTVNVAEVSLLSVPDLQQLQPGTFVLASLNFDVLDIIGSKTEVGFIRPTVLSDENGRGIAIDGVDPAIVVGRAPVPVPGTLLLVLGSLCGWRIVRRQKLSMH